jgi:RNA polymerase sigma factor (sigma-70 family)
MTLCDLIKGAQSGNEICTLTLVERFIPLLRKYAGLLKTEDSFEMLLLGFLEVIMSLDLQKMQSTKDGALVNYFAKATFHSFLKFQKKIYKESEHTSLYEGLSEAQKYCIQNKLVAYDDLFEVEYDDLFTAVLTDREREVLVSTLVEGNTAAFIAEQLGVSRQNVNQIRRKALSKLGIYIEL